MQLSKFIIDQRVETSRSLFFRPRAHNPDGGNGYYLSGLLVMGPRRPRPAQVSSAMVADAPRRVFRALQGVWRREAQSRRQLRRGGESYQLHGYTGPLQRCPPAAAFLRQEGPVLDSTAIEGAYDFTLGFSLRAAAQNTNEPGNGPSDPNGALSLFEALNSQLGLKLALEKRTAPVIVIDHVEQKPVEN